MLCLLSGWHKTGDGVVLVTWAGLIVVSRVHGCLVYRGTSMMTVECHLSSIAIVLSNSKVSKRARWKHVVLFMNMDTTRVSLARLMEYYY